MENLVGRVILEITVLGQAFESWQALLLDPWIDLGLILLVSLVAMSDFYRRFFSSIREAPRLDGLLDGLDDSPGNLPPISVIIPAYNEAVNIEGCVKAVLANELPADATLQLIVADDASTDDTLAIAQSVAEIDERVEVFTTPPRPADETWRGKNWACHCAIAKATGEYILFIDADVRVGEAAIARSLRDAKAHQSDLLSCAPAIVCGCFSEWIVQPLMASLIAVGFDFEGVNDAAKPETALAAGPFMLFRREAYDKIGGHRTVADDPVEDLALAALIKSSGLSLRYVLGLEIASVRMYRSFGDLWEGWTKNYHLGGGRNIALTTVSALAVCLIFTMPWLGLAASIAGTLAHALTGAKAVAALSLSAVAVSLQIALRQVAAKLIGQSPRYLWLGWLGGLLVSAIAITSIIKTETGWGWTWRGRSLSK